MLTIQLYMRSTNCAVAIAKGSARGDREHAYAGVDGTVVHGKGVLEVREGKRTGMTDSRGRVHRACKGEKRGMVAR